MKRLICLCLIFMLVFSLSACTSNVSVSEFSFSEDSSCWSDDEVGIKEDSFNNITETIVNSVEDVLNLAKNELTVAYDCISVAYDKETDLWRVDFWTESQLGGSQTVYIDSNGITKLCIWDE